MYLLTRIKVSLWDKKFLFLKNYIFSDCNSCEVKVNVEKTSLNICQRCWLYKAGPGEELCSVCSKAVKRYYEDQQNNIGG